MGSPCMGMGCLGALCDKLCIKCMLDVKRPGMAVKFGFTK